MNSQPFSGFRSRDAFEAVIQGMLRELLLLDEVPIDRPFFDLGGHSLMALQLQDDILSEFGCELSIETFFGTSSSVEDLASAVRHGVRGDGEGLSTAALAAPAAVRLYCVPGAAGSAVPYQDLADSLVHNGVQVRVIQSIGTTSAAEPDGNVAAAAERVADVVRRDAGEPVFLLGHGTGGLIAYEASHRLVGTNVKVSGLVLVDCAAPVDSTLPQPSPAAVVARSLGCEPSPAWESEASDDAVARLLRDSAVAGGLLPEDFDAGDLARQMRVAAAALDAARRYRPSRSPLDVPTAVLARPVQGMSADLEWSRYLAAAPETAALPGPAEDLLSSADVKAVDDVVRRMVTLTATPG